MRFLAVCVLALLCASSAYAHFGNGVHDARKIAERRFPDTCGPVALEHRPMPEPYIAWTDGSTCTVWLDGSFHRYSWLWRCTALVHEYGHLAGYGHSPNPDSVMNASPNPYRGCKR